MRHSLHASLVACLAWSVSACSPPATTDASTDAVDAARDTVDVHSTDTVVTDVADVAMDSAVDAAADTVDVATVDAVDVVDVIDVVVPTDAPVDADDASVDVPLDAADDVVDASSDDVTDAAEDAGSDAIDDVLVDTGADVPTDSGPASRRVFVSSMGYSANFGGYAAADTQCQSLADAAALGGTWMAWVSTSVSSPSARFTHWDGPYVRVDGTVVATNWLSFASSAHASGITTDEHGTTVPGAEVWTATTPSGNFAGAGCNDFTSNSNSAPFAQVGISDRSDSAWTTAYVQFCDRVGLRFYCVEQ